MTAGDDVMSVFMVVAVMVMFGLMVTRHAMPGNLKFGFKRASQDA